MNIPALVGSSVDTLFALFDSVAQDGTFYADVPGTYDTATGTPGGTTTQTAVRFLFGNFEEKAIDGDRIKSGDKKIFIKRSQLPTQPKRDDYLLDQNGGHWDIEFLSAEPSAKLWVLRGRKQTV